MPHSLYVGSSLVHARLREFDIKEDLYTETDGKSISSVAWRPSYRAIKATLSYTFAELCITIFVIAVFINTAILIVAATRLPESAGDADLFGMYSLFKANIGQAAATIFAIGLLFSGTSAGIVATMAGQLVMEGAINIRINPFVRRLITRLIAIIPAMIIAAAVGRTGLGAALNACNVVLSIGLIFLTAPIVWYTSRAKYMTVVVSDRPQVRSTRRWSEESRRDAEDDDGECRVNFANGWFTIFWAVIVWLLIVILNLAAIVLLALGKGDD
jgi:metal iron transporter